MSAKILSRSCSLTPFPASSAIIPELVSAATEFGQDYRGSDSAWSPEDLQSNELGRNFGEKAKTHDRPHIASSGWYENITGLRANPVLGSSLFQIGDKWRELLVDAGAVSWQRFSRVKGLIDEDVAAFRLDASKQRTIAGAKEWREKTALWRCLCSGDRVKDRSNAYR